MARLARVVATEVPHHVTQRGNARRYILDSDADRAVYLDLLRESATFHGLSVVGYCLMSNHAHLIVVPHRADTMALAMKEVHGRYASYWNARRASSGHVWQGRFYSCPLDTDHLWEALRYTELNPVRAGLVQHAVAWPWSSAAAHTATGPTPLALEMDRFQQRWQPQDWAEFLGEPQSEAMLEKIRQYTHTGRPLGSAEFVTELEAAMGRLLAPQKGGRPAKPAGERKQKLLPFDG